MFTLKKGLKVLLYFLVIFLGFVAVYLISAYFMSRIAVGGNDDNSGEIEVFLKSNGVHTDIVMPVKSDYINWSEQIKMEHINSPANDFKYIGMGWGDKGFYLQTPSWGDLTFKTAFVATFALGSTAMHCTYYKDVEEGEKCVRIKMSNAEYQQLIDYVQSSFQQNEKGDFIHIETNANYGLTDAFYQANGTYHLFHTCNTWTNNALKASNQKASLWTPFDGGLFEIYEKMEDGR